MSDDLISRQAAIDAVRNYLVGKNVSCDGTLTCRLIENEVISKLPSTQPERKTGHWEDVPHKSVEHGEVVVDGKTVRCSVCKHAEKGWNKGMNYCPECGAKMEVNGNE